MDPDAGFFIHAGYINACLLSEPGPGPTPEQMTEQALYRMNLANWLMRRISYRVGLIILCVNTDFGVLRMF